MQRRVDQQDDHRQPVHRAIGTHVAEHHRLDVDRLEQFVGNAENDAAGHLHQAAWNDAGAAIALLAASGDVRATWSFSAVTVLLYYPITNLAALRVRDGRFVPRAVLDSRS